MKKKLLITGVSGFLGWNLTQQACENWDVFGIAYSHPVDISNVNVNRINLTEYGALKDSFSQIKPDAVIHAAAMTDPNECQNYPSLSRKINVDVSVNIAGLCSDLGIPCVFTSTDLVFNGLHAPYHEDSEVSPVSLYGEQKAIAEEEMINRYPNMTVCRMPLMFGDPGPVATSFIQPMINDLSKGKSLNLFVDEIRTPVSGHAAAKGLLLMLDCFTGLIHLGGNERISRYDFGMLLCSAFDLDKARLNPCKQSDMQMVAPRPPDVSLTSDKAFALGYQPLALAEELEKLFLNG